MSVGSVGDPLVQSAKSVSVGKCVAIDRFSFDHSVRSKTIYGRTGEIFVNIICVYRRILIFVYLFIVLFNGV